MFLAWFSFDPGGKSVAGQEFVQVEQGAGKDRPGRVFHRIDGSIPGAFPDPEQFVRFLFIGGKSIFLPEDQVRQRGDLARFGFAAKRDTIGKGNPFRGGRTSLFEDPLTEGTCRLDKLRFVQGDQGLEWRVGAWSDGGALFPAGCVKGGHGWMRRRALPVGVHGPSE